MDSVSEKSTESIHVQVRMCKDCNHTLFSRREYAEELAKKPPDLRSYETLIQFERGIRALLPRFQSLLMILQYAIFHFMMWTSTYCNNRDPEKPPTSMQLTEASKIRRRLMDAFTQYDVAAKRIRDLPTQSSTQRRLQKAIYQQATNFLHLHMLPLKTLPKILKHQPLPAPSSSSSSLINGINGRHPSNLSVSRLNGTLTPTLSSNHLETASNSSTNTLISSMEAEERQLREKLIVLEEQRFMVDEMLATARKRRKFDEVTSLTQNLADLKAEIENVNAALGKLDFGALYEAGGDDMGEAAKNGVRREGSMATLVPSVNVNGTSASALEQRGDGDGGGLLGRGGIGGGERRGSRFGSFFGKS